MSHPPLPDAQAFAALYDRYAPELARWLRRRADPDSARELLAETWARAWAARARFDPEKGDVSAWLYGIARYELLHFYRSLEVERRARQRLGVGEIEDPAPAAVDRVDAQARRDELEALLAGLSPAVREAVILRAVEQLSHREIAARTGCSPQAARLRVSRGLRALRAAWEAAPAAAPLPRPSEGLVT